MNAKFITLGSRCYITKLMKEINANEEGPVDYILDLGPHGETILDLFTGSFHANLKNRHLEFYGWYDHYDEIDETMGPFYNRHAKIRYAAYFHEDLGADSTYQKILQLSERFLESIDNEEIFYVFLYPLKLQEDHIENAALLLDKLRVKRNRVLIINPTKEAKKLFPKTLELPKIRDIYKDFELNKKYRNILRSYINENF